MPTKSPGKPRPTAKLPEGVSKPQPVLPDRNSPQPAELPDWVTETPEMYSGYHLMMEEKSVWDEDIELTRAEYIALKAHLAKLRGYVVPEEPAA